MRRPSAVAIGDSEIARRLYSGRYADILAATIDSAAAGCESDDVGFVVGALCFVGRTAEAELLFENHRRRKQLSPRTRAAGGFFLTMAYARSGNFERAARTLERALGETSRRRDAWSRSFLFQGIACCHYFAARFERAARAALNAQGCAMQARFAYVQMLATDMRAHVLTQRGELDEGLRLLDQARSHAGQLGFDVNVRVIEASIALERARVTHPVDAIAELEHLLDATDIQDGYSRRLLLCEVAKCYALLGRGEDGRHALEEATRLASKDARAQAALSTARAEVARVVGGWNAAKPHIAEARRLLDGVNDPPLLAEVAGLALGSSTWLGEHSASAAATEELLGLVSAHRLYRARSWLHAYTTLAELPETDTFAHVVRQVVGSARAGVESRVSTQAVLRTGLWGLTAEASGLSPGRRIHLFDDAEVLESEGNVLRLSGLPPRGRAVLAALDGRALAKEPLLAVVWGVSKYRPERHDSLIKTTISRVRAALGRKSMWIETVEGGYRLADGVSIVAHGYQLSALPTSLSALVEQAEPHAKEEARATRWARLARELSMAGEHSVGELSQRVRASLRTVSRDLSEMHRQGLIQRVGEGRATKYRASDTTPSVGAVAALTKRSASS